MTIFIDGNHNVKGCTCTSECEFPCWQQVGLNDKIGTSEYVCCCANQDKKGSPDD